MSQKARLTLGSQQERMRCSFHSSIPMMHHKHVRAKSRSTFNRSTHLIHPKAPPRRIVSGCSVYTTILVNKGSSSGEIFPGVIGLGKAGKGRRSNGRVEGSYITESGWAVDSYGSGNGCERDTTHHANIRKHTSQEMHCSLPLGRSISLCYTLRRAILESLYERSDRFDLGYRFGISLHLRSIV